MNCYFDTSALIKNYIEETGSETVSNLLNAADAVFVSELTLTECFSTLRRLLLEARISENAYAHVKDEIRRDFAYFTRVDIGEALPECEKLIDLHQLKTLDSIQLASSLRVRTEIRYFVCCDQRLLTAAVKEQLSTIDPYAEEAKQHYTSLE
ncbi:MAG: PIN domain-containing protein [Spirochaetaceae bacterium]|nr:MAG: PIN domain-containing protein [Spirochaetaceae bacterium]